mgnify:FL=1
MVNDVQKYISTTYNIPLDILKGKVLIKNSDHYKLYNLSIILCWLLHPSRKYGCKSLIARLHSCQKNRVYRLFKFYNKNQNFKSFVDSAIETYNIKECVDKLKNQN